MTGRTTTRTLLHTLTDADPSDPSRAKYVYVYTDDDTVHRFESGSSRWGVDVYDIPAAPIETVKYWPRYLPAWTRFAGKPTEEGLHIKKPRYMHDESKAWWERERTMRTLVINEHVRAHPHPNVLHYEGAVVDKGHVSALAFRKLDCMLHDVVVSKFKPGALGRKVFSELPPLENVMRDVKAATDHLLDLGYVYLDISHRDIMWDADHEVWCLIDLSECYAPGTVFYDGIPGSPRWKDVNARVVEPELLKPMLAKLEKYVATGVLPDRD